MSLLKETAKTLMARCGYQISRIDPERASSEVTYTNLLAPQPYMGEEFMNLWHKWCESMGHKGRKRFSTSLYTTYKATKYLVSNDVRGDFVESGVLRGAQCVFIALTLQHLGASDRTIYMYDTYEGMPEPSENDYDLNKPGSTRDKWKSLQKNGSSRWNYGSFEQVRTNMLATGYDEAKIIMVKGKVQDTVPDTKPDRIALLRLDTDFYESTRSEMAFLYPRLVSGGILIVDGYGRWGGQKKAVDEFFAKTDKEPLLLRVGYNDWVTPQI